MATLHYTETDGLALEQLLNCSSKVACPTFRAGEYACGARFARSLCVKCLARALVQTRKTMRECVNARAAGRERPVSPRVRHKARRPGKAAGICVCVCVCVLGAGMKGSPG